MTDNKPVTKSVILEHPRASKEAAVADTVEPRPQNQSDLVAATVAATMKEMLPYLQAQQAPQREAVMPPGAREARAKVIANMNREFDMEVRRNTDFIHKLAKSPKSDYVTLSIPRVFREYIGDYLLVGLNGSVINFPVDGRPHRVHKAFVPIIRQKVQFEDQKIDFMERTERSDVAEFSDSR